MQEAPRISWKPAPKYPQLAVPYPYDFSGFGDELSRAAVPEELQAQTVTAVQSGITTVDQLLSQGGVISRHGVVFIDDINTIINDSTFGRAFRLDLTRRLGHSFFRTRDITDYLLAQNRPELRRYEGRWQLIAPGLEQQLQLGKHRVHHIHAGRSDDRCIGEVIEGSWNMLKRKFSESGINDVVVEPVAAIKAYYAHVALTRGAGRVQSR